MDPADKFRLPIVPHAFLGASDCCGCLVVEVRGNEADIICNECEALIRTVPASEVEKTLTELQLSENFAMETCPKCGSVNIFPGFSSMIAFICKECGESVSIKSPSE